MNPVDHEDRPDHTDPLIIAAQLLREITSRGNYRHEHSEDMCQNILTRFWHNPPKLTHAELKTYLITAVRHEIYSHHRHRITRSEKQAYMYDRPDTRPPVPYVTDLETKRRQVEFLLTHYVSKRNAGIYRLRLQGYSYQEIADKTQVTRKVVRSVLHNVTRELRRMTEWAGYATFVV